MPAAPLLALALFAAPARADAPDGPDATTQVAAHRQDRWEVAPLVGLIGGDPFDRRAWLGASVSRQLGGGLFAVDVTGGGFRLPVNPGHFSRTSPPMPRRGSAICRRPNTSAP